MEVRCDLFGLFEYLKLQKRFKNIEQLFLNDTNTVFPKHLGTSLWFCINIEKKSAKCFRDDCLEVAAKEIENSLCNMFF